MKKVLLTLLLAFGPATLSFGIENNVPIIISGWINHKTGEYVQCGPGGCQPGGYGGPGGGWEPIWQPQQQPRNGPQDWTPPVGGPGTPQFEPNPPSQEPNPPFPNPPPAKPPSPEPTPPKESPELIKIQEILIKIDQRLTIIEQSAPEKGEKGDKGDQGEKGEKGDKGDPGEVPVINYEEIEANLWAKIEQHLGELEKNRKPFRIRIYDPTGKFTTPYATVRDGKYVDLIISTDQMKQGD